MERPANQIREELSPDECLLGCNWKAGQRPARSQQVLDRVDAEDRRDQRRHRRQATDVMSDALRHTLVLQAAGQVFWKAIGQSSVS